jgi:ATP-binding cassette, subfamily B, bacterial
MEILLSYQRCILTKNANINMDLAKPSVFQFFWRYLKPFSWQIVVILLSITIVSSAILGLGYALRYLIDQGFVAHSVDRLNQAFILLLIIVIILSVASYVRSIRVNWICEQLEANIKKDAYKNILQLSPSYFDSIKISDILSRLTSDLTLVSNSLVMIASFSLRNSFMAVGGLILLCFSSIKLTLYVLIILPVILIPLIIIGRKTKNLSRENQQNIASSNAHLEETTSFIRMVQAYGHEKFENQRFVSLIDQALVTAKNRIKLRSLLFALVIGLVLSSVSFVLWIGGHDVLDSKMTAGALSSFIFYAVLVATSTASLSEVYSDWQRAAGALDRIIDVVEAKTNITSPANSVEIIDEHPDLILENISFYYPTRPETKVLDNINFKVSSGSIVALVGPSGAGKSSLFQLLLRFYDATSGNIKLGDIDIKAASLDSLRSQFALVSQEPIIFSGSAYDNILYGKTDATKEEVEAAAQAAEILAFFQSLPEGLNTYLGEKGLKLSGGQKQRLSIARAILRSPKILLLDEATSSLDSENEKLVQLALSRLRKNRTTLVIAHRISTIAEADSIIVMDKGAVIAQGKHKDLIQKNDLYKKLSQDYTSL